MKVGIIGCGRISKAHVRALSTVAGVELVGVCDRDRDRALEIASLAPHAKGFDDSQVMIRELGLDAVHVLTPPATHAKLAIQAMEAGCHVFVEKPMAISTAEAADVIAAAERTGRKLCIGHNYLFKPSVQKALRLIQSGAVGEIVYLNTYYGLAAETGSYATAAGRAQSAWRWHLRGGVFADFLPHLVYLQLGFIESIDRIAGVTMLPHAETGKERSEMAIQYEGCGVLGSMIISMRAKPYAKYIEIYGTKGIIHADLAREVCVVHREKRMPGALAKMLFSVEASSQLAFGTAATAFKVALGRMKSMPELSVLVGRFYESIRNDTPPPVPLEQGRQTVDVIERIWTAMPAQQLAPPMPVREKQESAPMTAAEKEFASIVQPGTKVFVSGATGFLGQRLVRSLGEVRRRRRRLGPGRHESPGRAPGLRQVRCRRLAGCVGARSALGRRDVRVSLCRHHDEFRSVAHSLRYERPRHGESGACRRASASAAHRSHELRGGLRARRSGPRRRRVRAIAEQP